MDKHMALDKILLLGDPRLYEVCEPVAPDEVETLRPVIADLHAAMMGFRAKYKAGRAIAAPQIGCMKRLVYMHIDAPLVFINPVLSEMSNDMITLWDDCMSFPDLLVKVQRHARCRITYRDMDWQEQSMLLEGDLSELLQHEVDHLDGILALARALDEQSIAYRSQRHLLTI
jgi:peptide deformylase